MKIFIPAAIMVCIFALSSCQKELTFVNSSPSSSGSTGSCNTYFPMTVGNTWTYDLSGTPQVLNIVSPDSVIMGKTYFRVTETSAGATSTSFYREESGILTSYTDYHGSPIQLTLLKTDAAVGDKWTDNIVVPTASERIEYQMMEKNISYAVDAVNYTNVIHTQYQVRADLPGVYTNELIQITDVWWAKCIGIIDIKTQSLFGGTVLGSFEQKLKTYTLK